MTTVWVIVIVWLTVTAIVLHLLGRAIREADRREDEAGRRRAETNRDRVHPRAPVAPRLGIPDLAELEAWFREDGNGGPDTGTRSDRPA